MKKIYVVTDLGPGDGGKGGVVHKISHMQKAHTILKVGGAQGSHGVSVSSGERFAFSQFGCGTFEGVRTHLTPRFIASPEGILNEAAALRYQHGIYDVFDLLTVDEEVICATPYHGIASRIKELARKDDPRGTIGTGVGEAYRYTNWHADLTIQARHLSSAHLRERLVAVRTQVQANLLPLLNGDFLQGDRAAVEDEVKLLYDDGFLDYTGQRFSEVAKQVKIVDREYFRKHILSKEGVAVVESSHGVLTDHYQGFHPHTSAIQTLPHFAKDMLLESGYGGDIINIGVTRAYSIRHGAGPIPTADESMSDLLLPGSHKQENRYQGKVRVGSLDLKLLRYAIASCGGVESIDGLAISWFDQIKTNGSWQVCDTYTNNDDLRYFTENGEIRVRHGNDLEQLQYQEELGKQLQGCGAIPTEYDVASNDRNQLYTLCSEVLENALGVKVRMVSFGPTEQDKVCR